MANKTRHFAACGRSDVKLRCSFPRVRSVLAVTTMPYATCPNCKSTFHLNVKFDALNDWNKKFPPSEDGNRYIECFFCWKPLKKYDVVEVWRVPLVADENIKKGDLGAVLMIHDQNNLEVECVNEDGSSKWLSTVPRNCVWYKRLTKANNSINFAPSAPDALKRAGYFKRQIPKL